MTRGTSATTAEPRICRSDVIPPPRCERGGRGRTDRWPCPRCTNSKPRRDAGARGGEGKEGTGRGQSKVTNRVAVVASGPNGVPGTVGGGSAEAFTTAALSRMMVSGLTSCEVVNGSRAAVWRPDATPRVLVAGDQRAHLGAEQSCTRREQLAIRDW